MPKIKKQENIEETIKELNIDKKALVKEIKKEVIEELDDEVLKRVEYETKNKLDKMEKRIYKYKNMSILKRNIVILIFLGIIIFETKILYDNNLLFKFNNKKNTEINSEVEQNNNENKEEKDSKWYIDNYSYLLDNIKTNISGEDKYYLYKKNYTQETIRNAIRLNMAYQLLNDGISKENSVISIKEKDLKEAYKKIFGNLDNYKAENFSNDCVQFVYNKDVFMAIDTKCEDSKDELVEKIDNIHEKDNKIIINTIVGIYNKENKSLVNMDGEKLADKYSNNINEYANKLSKYEYIFEIKDKDYHLKEINKLDINQE